MRCRLVHLILYSLLQSMNERSKILQCEHAKYRYLGVAYWFILFQNSVKTIASSYFPISKYWSTITALFSVSYQYLYKAMTLSF